MSRWLVRDSRSRVRRCGVRTRPLPPELVQPEPPTALVASSNVDGVKLTWRRPALSGGKHMRDLGGFDVERAVGDSYDFASVTTVLLDDQTRFRQEKLMQWTDTAVEVGQTLSLPRDRIHDRRLSQRPRAPRSRSCTRRSRPRRRPAE
jgi:hypothetical protein